MKTPQELQTETELVILTICCNVRYLRVRNGYSRNRLCGIMNISPLTLRKLERGILPNRMDFQALFRLTEHFGLQFSQLFSPLCDITESSKAADTLQAL